MLESFVIPTYWISCKYCLQRGITRLTLDRQSNTSYDSKSYYCGVIEGWMSLTVVNSRACRDCCPLWERRSGQRYGRLPAHSRCWPSRHGANELLPPCSKPRLQSMPPPSSPKVRPGKSCQELKLSVITLFSESSGYALSTWCNVPIKGVNGFWL